MVSELDVSKVKFVLFDWDNTLAESKTPLLFAIRQVIAEKNLPSWEALQSVRDHLRQILKIFLTAEQMKFMSAMPKFICRT